VTVRLGDNGKIPVLQTEHISWSMSRLLRARHGASSVAVSTIDTNPSRQPAQRLGVPGTVPLARREPSICRRRTRRSTATGASAVMLNITAAQATRGLVTVWPTGATRPEASTRTSRSPGQNIATWRSCHWEQTVGHLFSQSGTHLLADVAGWFPTPANQRDGCLFRPASILPGSSTRDRQRHTDTTPIPLGASIDLVIAGRRRRRAGVGAVVLNVTAVQATRIRIRHRLAVRQTATAGVNLNVTASGQNILTCNRGVSLTGRVRSIPSRDPFRPRSVRLLISG